MTDINKLIREGKSLDYVLEAVKAEYAATAKREAEKEREAKAKALKVEASRNALIKAMNDYLVVLAGDPAVLNLVKPFRDEFEKSLKQVEKELQKELLNGIICDGCGKVKCECEEEIFEEEEEDFLDQLIEEIAADVFKNKVPKVKSKTTNFTHKATDDEAIQKFLEKICK